MNRSSLAAALARDLHLRPSFAKKIVTMFQSTIATELRTGKRVYLQQLGAFHTRVRPERRWYDPRTRKIKRKPPHTDVVFRPSKTLLKDLAKKIL